MAEFVEVEANKRSRESRMLLHGVGVNDAWYMVAKRVKGKHTKCPYYTRWASMLKRAYDPKSHDRLPTYRDVTVCEEWHTFSVFKVWMEQQDWEGKHLDKDVIKPGNKEYGPEACCFITQELNKLLLDRASCRGKEPRGVHQLKVTGRFKAYCSSKGRVRNLGHYDTAEEASAAYKKAKSEIVRKAAQEATCPRVAAGLLDYVRLILGGGIND